MNNYNLELLAKSNPRETIREHTDKLLEEAKILNEIYCMDEEIFQLLCIACEYHDYGKINRHMQNRLEHTGSKFNSEKEIPHNVLSAFAIDYTQFKKEDDYKCVLYAVLNHHFRKNNTISETFNDHIDLLRTQILECGFFDNVFRKVRNIVQNPPIDDKRSIFVKGFLHRCDYSASANTIIEYRNDFLENKLELYRIVKGYEWKELQKFCHNNSDNNLVITAPTGQGKTEAALLWIGDNKGLYILPLQSAINAMFDRISDNILNSDITTKLALMHANATSYLADKNVDELDLMDYQQRAKQFSFPLSISTPDQLFNFVLRYPGYEIKLATAAFSKIVIDEIQAYDPIMLSFIIHGIHEIIDMGGKVAILTATLPGFVKDYLQTEYVNGEYKKYPFAISDFSTDEVRHNLCMKNYELQVEDISKLYNENLTFGRSNKILVICNTVKKAQEMYRQLSDVDLPQVKIKLLHAKYHQLDRQRLEKEILEDGKTFELDKVTIHKDNVIWVTTQIVEASLDIDFDYLFTELSELSGLFQRLGRCNRKGKKNNYYDEQPNCYIYTQIPNTLLLSKDNAKGFIDKTLYDLSKKALLDFSGEITEKQKKEMINNWFTTKKLKENNSLFLKEYRANIEFLSKLSPNTLLEDDAQKRLRNIISFPVIPKNVYTNHLNIIEQAISILANIKSQHTNKENAWIIKLQAQNEIMKFVVNIGFYEWNVVKKYVVKEIIISTYNKIPVVECSYDSMGFTAFFADSKMRDNCGVFL